ncbi:helix-hairpin-helix domain-containing protein [Methanomicrobium antiquum]|uniref:Helix-hairpin-helix domain-containing protein n=1 Tax=Methanomicrobium antiquum TaxID=487686 RepID=A0AAF0JMW3_9EURY|nr:helix-hairpin-helix domain-containing protein [Methanomicrobium antiquum]MDD3977804.1 helix-hairpin-helix domain-containing protein [Methanomicrobium sp.]WFN36836.1 helix-hairpin-helix domain-containing protein [Methanomicrobium antiquum]
MPVYFDYKASEKDLMKIPGVGKKTAGDLIALGYTSVESLKGEDPEEMYARLCIMQGGNSDRCNLYVYRLAVYFAENEGKNPNPSLLLWWNWKD